MTTTLQKPGETLQKLAVRYETTEQRLAEAFHAATERLEMPGPWEFDGVLVWPFAYADAWYAKHLLEEFKIKQFELAEALDVSAGCLSRWLSGGGLPPYMVPKLRRICEEIVANRPQSDEDAA